MERGVIVGGVLISTSFLLAVLLNHSAVKEGAQIPAADAQSTQRATSPNPTSPQPSIRALDERVGSSSTSDDPRCCEPGDDSCVARKNQQAQGGEPPCDSR